MKRELLAFTLAVLTIGLLGSCAKIYERIDNLEKKVDGLENNRIATIEQQISAIIQSIADLETIRTNIRTLIEAKTAQGEDITKLKTADQALEGKIAELKTYIDGELSKYATKDWANATFATLEKQAEIIADVEKLKSNLAGLDEKLDSTIATLETTLKGWVNEQLKGYYTTAQMDAKITELQSDIDDLKTGAEADENKIAELETKLDELTEALETAKTAIKTEYEAAITAAVTEYNGNITQTIQTKIDEVNETITALTGRVAALEATVAALSGDVDALKAMIQSVTILPVSADGRVEASGALLTISCIVKPADAVTDISEDSVKILISNAKTKAATSYETVAVSRLTNKDSKTGELTIKADISSVAPARNGMAHMAAVKISSGISRYITGFYLVYTKPNATTESGDTTKVSLSADPDFPDAVSGILPVDDSFDSSKPTTIKVEGIGNITFNEDAVEQIKENANGATNILLKVEDVTNTLANPVPDADVVIEVTMKTYDEKGDEVFSEDNAGEHSEVTIEIPMDDDVAFVKTVVLVNDKGEPIEGGVVPGSEKIENGILSFKVNHFSKYAVDYVKQKDFVSVTGVSLEPTSVSLSVGDTLRLAATITPENATNPRVTWSSSNTAVATVGNDGKVTAVAAGTATITVTTEDGSKTATCTVTVSDPIVNVTGVSLDKTTMALEVGDTLRLAATITPTDATNKNVTWSSSNEDVATVGNDGKVTAVAAGTATITVTTVDGSKTATCTVTVSNPIVSVTDVSLNKTTMTLTVGGTETLTATVAPDNADNKEVSWSSDKPEVATVDTTGKVTAVAAGTATITVTTMDGAKTATCIVTVEADVVPVTGVSIEPTSVSLSVGDTLRLTATVAPDNASNQNVTWSSSNKDVATVGNDGKVTAVAAGTATITVTTEDVVKATGQPATATCTVTVTPKAGTDPYGHENW